MVMPSVSPLSRIAPLLEAATIWWSAKRPAGWSLAQHRRTPTVNCRTPAERALAEAVARRLAPLRPLEHLRAVRPVVRSWVEEPDAVSRSAAPSSPGSSPR